MAITWRQTRKLVKYMVILLIWYSAIKFIGIVLLGSGLHQESSHSLRGESSGPILKHVLMNSSDILTNCHKTVRVVVVALNPSDCRELSRLLKTVLHHRNHGLHIYMLANTFTQRIMHTLLETWQLPYVTWDFILVDQLKPPKKNTEAFLLGCIPFILPQNARKVLYISNRIRVLDNLVTLWDQFDRFSSSQKYGVLSHMVRTKKDKHARSAVDMLMLKVGQIRRDIPHGLDKIRSIHQHVNDSQDMYTVLLGGHPYNIPCNWGVGLGLVEKPCDLGSSVKGFIWEPANDRYSKNEIIERGKEDINSILSSDAELYRHQSLSCSPPQTHQTNVNQTSKCAEYRYDAALKKRTHLYYIAPSQMYERTVMDNDEVVLMTQLTLDRFVTFERFMKNWEGPVTAVVYATDSEALALPHMVENSGVLKNRKNIVYHLVHKRGKFYPINYLRNVAVNHTEAPYVLFVDVDLVVNRGIYSQLKDYVTKYMMHSSNVTLVVAAFEALVPIAELPSNKSSILSLMAQAKVVGYRMNRGWNLGHKPTDYPQWVKADKPYKAIWKNAYEPYMVLSSRNLPIYQEILLERMGDKIAYGRDIYARGYDFLVLPDAFILHLPHPTSAGTNMWKHYPGYARCSALLFNEYSNLLKKNHPDKTF